MEDEKKQRRNFLKAALATIAGAGLVKFSQKASPEISEKKENKKIKMLTPEGKLVEIDESVYAQISAGQQRVSNKEVQNWMKTSKV
ncbi:MAG: twin-arginine translocation signal domain-containing protein [Bacteroidia bacterium]|nr:twin-arginine translocation signal domain-containing protein [Bacteroidia bacterium]